MTRTTIQYKDLSVRDPAPYGAAGAAWQANFKELADRIGPCNFTATVAPTVNDDTGDGYAIGSLWYDTVAQRVYWCASATAGAAVWIEISSSATAAITSGTITGITDLAVADGGTGASDAATARTNLGLGTIATQAADSVNIDGGAIDGTAIGATTAATAKVTTLQTTQTIGVGGAPVANYPVVTYQSADAKGYFVWGYDDRSTSYLDMHIDAGGNANINANGGLNLAGTAALTIATSGYFSFTAGLNQPVYINYGALLYFRDCDASNAERATINSATGEIAVISDTVGLKLDAAGTTTIISNGTIITVNKPLKATGYQSSDGTAGATADVALAKVGGGTRTLSFKNGLYTGYTDS